VTEPLPEPLKQAMTEAEAMSAYMASKGEPEHIRVGLWARFIEIHKGRTPERIAAMEKAMGLD
jgi:hypothetical protein